MSKVLRFGVAGYWRSLKLHFWPCVLVNLLRLDPEQVGSHASAHVQRGAVQCCFSSALQWRDPGADHNVGEHRVRGDRNPGTDLKSGQHERLVPLVFFFFLKIRANRNWNVVEIWEIFASSGQIRLKKKTKLLCPCLRNPIVGGHLQKVVITNLP